MTGVGRIGWRRWWAVAAVLVVLALLTYGWQLVADRMPDEAALPAGTRLSLAGVGGVTVAGAGWRLRRSHTSWRHSYALRHGGMVVWVASAFFDRRVRAGVAWQGMREMHRARGETLGSPDPSDAPAQVATLRNGGRSGFAAMVLNADGIAAVEVGALGGPGTTPGDRATARGLLPGIHPDLME